jgi:hypothetical protein
MSRRRHAKEKKGEAGQVDAYCGISIHPNQRGTTRRQDRQRERGKTQPEQHNKRDEVEHSRRLLRIATIWLSLNFDFRMTAPDPEQSTFGCQSIGEACEPNSVQSAREELS